jgi:hypothetical protein
MVALLSYPTAEWSRSAPSGSKRLNVCSSRTSSTSSSPASPVSHSAHCAHNIADRRARTEMLFQTIQAAAVDTRSELYKHIVLSGGSSMYPGLPSRLEKEMKQLYLTRVLGGDSARLNVRGLPARRTRTDGRAEIQDPDRGPAAAQARRVPRRRRPRGHHEEPRGVLDLARGVVRAGPARSRQARARRHVRRGRARMYDYILTARNVTRLLAMDRHHPSAFGRPLPSWWIVLRSRCCRAEWITLAVSETVREMIGTRDTARDDA